MAINYTSNDGVVIWQVENSIDEPIPEPALLIKDFSDVIEIAQGDESILISRNVKNLNQIIKELQRIKKLVGEENGD